MYQENTDEVPFSITGRVALREWINGDWKTVFEQKNLVVDLAFDELFPQIFGRTPGAQIGIISIGTGGDYDASVVFQGQRVAPAATDTVMRIELFRAGIVQTNFPSPNEVEFVGLMREGEAVSTGIDEFGLLSLDGRMISHSINPESAGAGTPTVKYTKPLGAIYSVSWTLTIDRCP
jgi:hypothetical protein